MERCTKIVATVGPASNDEAIIERLLRAGVNVFRLNCSHGTTEEHAARIALLRRTAERLNLPITLLQDLQGPKIRLKEIATGSVQLTEGQTLTLTTRSVPGNAQIIGVDFPDLPKCVKFGSRILLDDGNLELSVTSVEADQVGSRVIIGGVLKSHKGVNLPGARLNIASFTEKDKADLAFGLSQSVDAIAMSFVRTASDVTRLRNAIAHLAPERQDTPIIAKLERPEALDNLIAIIEAADGVMVARGDLGVEMAPEVVPIAQKQIIEAANLRGKVVITATQMLESMINNPRPTRAEASDVANAIFDGTDAVMLSAETATGKYPVQAVEMMSVIIQEAETYLHEWGHCKGVTASEVAHDDTYYMTLAARELAHDRNVAAIAVFTKSGRTARLVSKARPHVPILAFTPQAETYRRMCLLWGVFPHLVPHAETIEEMLDSVEKAMMASTSIHPGQQVVLICGFPVDEIRPTNLALLYTVKEQF